VRDGRSGKSHTEDVPLGVFGAFLDGEGNFAGLAVAETHATGLVTDDDDGGELEATTTLHHLGDTVHVHHTRLTELTGLGLWARFTALTRTALATATTFGGFWLLYVGH
jgi:hypothetical protein